MKTCICMGGVVLPLLYDLLSQKSFIAGEAGGQAGWVTNPREKQGKLYIYTLATKTTVLIILMTPFPHNIADQGIYSVWEVQECLPDSSEGQDG